MSRAFLNEDKFEQAGDELVERPISPHANYVTPTGFACLRAEVQRLESLRAQWAARQDDAFALQRKAETERDLRYFSARLESAIVVDTTGHADDQVRFGASVALEDQNGERYRYTIVGEDEADIAQNKVSWISPLAQALTGHRVGETVVWRRPAGNLELTIERVDYPHAGGDASE